MVMPDGKVIQNRALSERTMHTRNSVVNSNTVAIVMAGNFQDEFPPKVQLEALETLTYRLDAIYHFKEIIGHRDASPTACPGEKLLIALRNAEPPILRYPEGKWEVWNITRYYSPEPGQMRYFRGGTGGYIADTNMNCGLYTEKQIAQFIKQGRTFKNKLLDDGTAGDCITTADGHKLQASEAFTIAACPPEIAFGTKIEVEGIGVVTCHDRGGAIKEKRLDIWAGIGMDALYKLNQYPGGYLRVRFL